MWIDLRGYCVLGETAPCPPAVARPAGICSLWNYELGCRVMAKACSLLQAGLGMPARTCVVPQAFQPADCLQGPQSLHFSLRDLSSLPHGHVRLRMLPRPTHRASRQHHGAPCYALHGPSGSSWQLANCMHCLPWEQVCSSLQHTPSTTTRLLTNPPIASLAHLTIPSCCRRLWPR